MNEPTLEEKVTKIVEHKYSPRTLKAAILALVADERRDNLYFLLGLQKAGGPKWLELPKETMLQLRDTEEREDNETV